MTSYFSLERPKNESVGWGGWIECVETWSVLVEEMLGEGCWNWKEDGGGMRGEEG